MIGTEQSFKKYLQSKLSNKRVRKIERKRKFELPTKVTPRKQWSPWFSYPHLYCVEAELDDLKSFFQKCYDPIAPMLTMYSLFTFLFLFVIVMAPFFLSTCFQKMLNACSQMIFHWECLRWAVSSQHLYSCHFSHQWVEFTHYCESPQKN